MMKTLASIVSLLFLACLAAAQAGEYAQCGGIGWTGATTCVSGWTCTELNPYYYQCLQGSSSSTTTTARTTTTTTKTSSSPLTTTTSTSFVSKTTTTTTTSSSPTATAFAKTNGLFFDIDGTTKYYAGSNSYWLSDMLTNNSDVDHILSDFYGSGLRIMRVWGFNDVTSIPSAGTIWFQLLNSNGTGTINTGADGLQRLDYVVESAEAHDVKLIINFVNNWDNYGGMPAYASTFGVAQTDWYNDTVCQDVYRNYVATIVARYKTSPAVFAWELANEPRCQGCETTTITDWVASTSAYIKSLDPNHMVCIGEEGFGLDIDSDGSYPYTYGAGTNFTANTAIDTIDFGTFHLYPGGWGETDDWGNTWISAHGAACAVLGKPCLFEEYGETSNQCSAEGAWQTTALATTGIAADCFWQFGDTISTSAFSQGQSPNDGYTIYYGTSEYTCLVTDHIGAINAG